MSNARVIIVGGFHEVIELCESCDKTIVGIIDNKLENTYFGYPILGKDTDASSLFSLYKDCEIVVTPDSPFIRERIVDYYSRIGFGFASLISPQARISKTAVIGEGSIVQAGVNISSASCIGKFVKLNTNCNVMHDCIISDYVTIAPNAVCLGRVHVDRSAYIGANCTVLPDLSIGKDAVVGAGAVVTKSVVSGIIVKGIPAKAL